MHIIYTTAGFHGLMVIACERQLKDTMAARRAFIVVSCGYCSIFGCNLQELHYLYRMVNKISVKMPQNKRMQYQKFYSNSYCSYRLQARINFKQLQICAYVFIMVLGKGKYHICIQNWKKHVLCCYEAGIILRIYYHIICNYGKNAK